MVHQRGFGVWGFGFRVQRSSGFGFERGGGGILLRMPMYLTTITAALADSAESSYEHYMFQQTELLLV